MNFEKKGKCFFKIYNTKTKKYKEVYLSNNEALKNIDVLQAGEDEEFVLTACKQTERQIIYVSGKSSSGKSYFSGKWADQYHEAYENRPIYLFSLVESDESIDRKFIKKIDLNKLVDAELSLSDFANSLVIMDDVDGDLIRKNKILYQKMKSIQDNIMLMGRHHNISLIMIAHETTRGRDSKRILNECNIIVIFPYHMNQHDLKYLCSEYIGLNQAQRRELLDIAKQTRSVAYIQNYPPLIFSSKKCYTIIPNLD